MYFEPAHSNNVVVDDVTSTFSLTIVCCCCCLAQGLPGGPASGAVRPVCVEQSWEPKCSARQLGGCGTVLRCVIGLLHSVAALLKHDLKMLEDEVCCIAKVAPDFQAQMCRHKRSY